MSPPKRKLRGVDGNNGLAIFFLELEVAAFLSVGLAPLVAVGFLVTFFVGMVFNGKMKSFV
jgi:hypothetical protein